MAVQVQPTDAEAAAAADLAAFLAERGPTDLHAIVVALPALKDFLQAAPLRLLPFCQLFPERFLLEPSDSLQHMRVRLRTEAEAAALEAKLAEKIHQYHQH